jgi:FAD/FMN-containing dehydrogenase/Fe-S oxidoreductase
MTTATQAAEHVDAEALASELRRRIRGEVHFDDGYRAMYAADASNYRQIPIGVVLPQDIDDVVETVALARRFGAPVLARGGGTSLAGQCVNVAVVMDFSKYLHGVLEVDPERRVARVEPGAILDDLRDAAEQHHLTFGPDPATHDHCTLGGMIGNNSCGVHALMAGKTSENVVSLDVLTYDGLRMTVGETSDEEYERIQREGGRRAEIYRGLRELRDRYAPLIRERFPDIPRRVSGFALEQLLPENGFDVGRALVGSEGTCATVLGATLRLVHSPPERTLVVLGYRDVFEAGDHIPDILEHGPIGLEGVDQKLAENIRKKHLRPEDLELLPEGGGWLLAEFGGDTREEADERARAMMRALEGGRDGPKMKHVQDAKEAARIWEIRESGLGATARVPGEPDTWPGWEDSAVPPERLGGYLRDLRSLYDRYGYEAALYGHFGQGCVHTRINFDLVTSQGIARFRAFMEDAADLAVRYGGSLSGEHGDGQARGELLPRMYGPELVEAFREFKSIWDPEWKMNPGKVVDPYRLDENLRLGTGYAPPEYQTEFEYPDDKGSLIHASLRCVGVGKCRRLNGEDAGSATMCPSFMVTREEMHSTRGRARMLFELLRNDSVIEAWREEEMHEALDLCLACKGCKGDCPVNVDMATYKAEFLSHYYAGRLRPVAAYSMGLIFWWARLASLAPGVVNFLGRAPGVGWLLKRAGGIATERALPRFAPRTFRQQFEARRTPPDGRPKVILWPDTFNNSFHPETAMAAAEVLEAAGYRVEVPAATLCCGRPLYDYGMLGTARHLLLETLDVLRDEIAAGTPVVGVEPSCVAVFRDEMRNLLAHREDARRLADHTFLLGEFLERAVEEYRPPPLRRKAIVHGHCHQKAIIGLDAELRILDRLGVDYEVLASGCCGMAGSFGFERDHYEISMQIGEHTLLPAVRKTEPDTLVITNGFSCREQIEQGTGRQAVTMADVIKMALDQAPERERPPVRQREGAASGARR